MDKNAKPYSLDHFIHASGWRSLAHIYSPRAKGCHSLDREALFAGLPLGLDPAGAMVLGAASRAWVQIHRGHSQQLDSLHRRRLRAGHRWNLIFADHADHAPGMDFDSVFLERD